MADLELAGLKRVNTVSWKSSSAAAACSTMSGGMFGEASWLTSTSCRRLNFSRTESLASTSNASSVSPPVPWVNERYL